MIVLIRKLLVRCLSYSVKRVRFNTKDPGDVCATAFLDDMVRIKKRTTQLLCQHPANGTLAGPHGSYQIDIC